MSPMKRRKWIRRLAYTSIILAVLAAVIAPAVPWIARRQLVAILEKQINGPVKVDRVSFRPKHVEVHGLQLFDGATPPRCWLSIDKATLDTTFWKAILGRETPKIATVDGMVGRFHLDKSIQLTTDFTPWADGFEFPFDQVDIRNARVEICLADQPPFGLDRIDMTIRGPTEALRVDGHIVGSLGGTWDVSAKVNTKTLETEFHVASDSLPVATDSLADLPYVPAELLEQVCVMGDTSVRVAIQNTPDAGLRYRFAVTSDSLSIALPIEDLTVTDGHYDLVVEDGVLTLRDFHGQIMGGRVALSGGLDLLGPVWQGKIEGELSDLSLSELPAEWNLPADIAGVVSGKVALEGNTTGSKAVLHGHARTALNQGKVFGGAVELLEADVEIRELAFDDWTKPPTIDGTATMRTEMEQLELSRCLAVLPVDLRQEIPRVSGRLGLKIGGTVPLADLSALASYEMAGQIRAAEVTCEQLTLRDVSVPLEYQGGTLSVASARAAFGEDGVLEGTVVVPAFAEGDITADLRCEGIEAREFERWIPDIIKPLEAMVAGSLEARVPIAQWDDPDAWRLDGSVGIPRVRVAEYVVSDVAGKMALRQGELQFDDCQAHWKDAVIRVAGRATLQAPFPYQGNFGVSDVDLLQVVETLKVDLPVSVTGKASVTGDLQGRLAPLDWQIEGEGRLVGSAVGPVELDSPSVDWRITPTQIEVSKARLGLFSGEIEMSAHLPLDGQTPGRASGTFRDLHPAPVIALMPSQPIQASGTASGEFELTGFEHPATMNGAIQFRGLQAEAKGASIQQLGGSVKVVQGQVDAEVEGKTFGGLLSLNGAANLADKPLSIAGRLSLDGLDASMLARVVNQPALNSLRAVVDAQMDLSATAPAFEPHGEGHVVVRDVAWEGTRITNEVRSRATLAGTSLKIQGISMGLAGGTVTGEAAMRLDQLGIGSFHVDVQRVRTERVLAPYDRLADLAKVRLDSTFHGRFAPGRVSATGHVRVSRGQVAGIPIREVSGPVRWTIDPSRLSGEASMRLTQGDLAGGHVAGDAKVEFGRSLSIDGRTTFASINLEPIAQAVPALSKGLTGRVSGRATVQARDMRSLRELSGSYDLVLSDSPVLQLPILNALADKHGIASASQHFSKTEVEGRITRGTVDINRMTMAAAGIHMFIEGTIGKRGQLDLDVSADTGQLMAAGMAVGLIRPIDLIRRRLIFLNMGGTVKRPIVMLDMERQIQQEVLLFFFPFVIQDVPLS